MATEEDDFDWDENLFQPVASVGGSSSSTAPPPKTARAEKIIDTASNQGTLPRIAAVMMPGKVVDHDEAIASLGGPSMVKQAMKNLDGKLRLRLCRDYKFQAPVPLERKNTSDVLVRAKKGPDGTWSCETVGLVQATFSPETMADYIFVPGKEFEYGAKAVHGSLDDELSGSCPTGDPYMPPAFFTRINTPRNYDFQDNPFGRTRGEADIVQLSGTSEGKFKRKWVAVSIVHFTDTTPAPAEPPEGASDQVREEEWPLVEKVREFFQTRPMWLRGPLEEQLRLLGFIPNVTVMQKALQVVAYLWSDGPWRSAYARLGFDPRDPANAVEAGWSMVIDFRDRFFRRQDSYYKAVQALRTGEGQKPELNCDYHFRTAPKHRSQLYQLTDIDDEGIQKFIREAKLLPKALEKSGWFSPSQMTSIRERMAVKAEVLRRCQESSIRSLADGIENRHLKAISRDEKKPPESKPPNLLSRLEAPESSQEEEGHGKPALPLPKRYRMRKKSCATSGADTAADTELERVHERKNAAANGFEATVADSVHHAGAVSKEPRKRPNRRLSPKFGASHSSVESTVNHPLSNPSPKQRRTATQATLRHWRKSALERGASDHSTLRHWRANALDSGKDTGTEAVEPHRKVGRRRQS